MAQAGAPQRNLSPFHGDCCAVSGRILTFGLAPKRPLQYLERYAKVLEGWDETPSDG